MGDEPIRMKPASPEQALFAEALQCATPEARAAYLDGACGTDAALRRRVEVLLRAAEKARLMSSSATEPTGPNAPISKPPTLEDRYQESFTATTSAPITRCIGRHGTGRRACRRQQWLWGQWQSNRQNLHGFRRSLRLYRLWWRNT